MLLRKRFARSWHGVSSHLPVVRFRERTFPTSRRLTAKEFLPPNGVIVAYFGMGMVGIPVLAVCPPVMIQSVSYVLQVSIYPIGQ